MCTFQERDTDEEEPNTVKSTSFLTYLCEKRDLSLSPFGNGTLHPHPKLMKWTRLSPRGTE